ncbi:MAG: CAAD domain-containing protein [Desmonostoc vinosum HA7617-LM4]|jgi:hypothetical protein|nr:CAAD domain-containing protein [Desmonostoc vinosum HA7617-LM4]
MESEVQQPEYANVSPTDDMTTIKNSETGNLSKVTNNNQFNQQASEIGRKVSEFSEKLPGYIVRFYEEYKLPIISFGLLVVLVTSLKILLAIVDAINDIPLVSPIFQLIGVSYVIWFIFRYFLKASTRQELAGEVDSIKKQITDDNIS